MLFVMNESIVKNSKESRKDEYFKEFPKVKADVVCSLVGFKSKLSI